MTGLACEIVMKEGVSERGWLQLSLSAEQAAAAAGLRQWLVMGCVLGAGRLLSVAALHQLASCRTAQVLLKCAWAWEVTTE
jgi:hypothetical protein